MRRRDVMAGFVGALASSRAVLAQTGSKVPVVGVAALATRESHTLDLEGLRQGLRERGYHVGQTIRIEERYADGDRTRFAQFAEELVRDGADVFVTPGPRAAQMAQAVAPKVPVVAVALPASYPALFESLAKPGGSVTGFSHIGTDLAPKRIELLREAVPALRSTAILYLAADPVSNDWAVETAMAARGRGLEAKLLGLPSVSASELAGPLASARAEGAQSLIVIRDFSTETFRADIARHALRLRLPTLTEHRSFAEAGALLSYGASLPDLFRRAAEYVDKILNGANPGELPIQLPTRFELVLNLGTAKALDLAFPLPLLAQADEVIE